MVKISWESPFQKESHPNKCLYCHVDEVKRIFNRFVDFLNFSKSSKTYKLIEKVIEYHDTGKLNPDWNFNAKISHSFFSCKYFEETIEKENRKPTPEDALILFLILKHHGSLKPITKYEEYEKIIESFKVNKLGEWFFSNFSKEDRIELADLYGIFKIADCLSASNSTFLPEPPLLDYNKLKEFLPDNKRREEQEEIQKIKRIGFLKAPTGWGKTKASLFYLLNKENIKKCFLIFPTITAINELYTDFKKLCGDKIAKYFYFYDVEAFEILEEREAQFNAFLSRHFLKPFIITTIDQFLLSFLQVGSYHTRRIMFKNAAIILDEIHLVNERMLYILLYFLKLYWNIYNFHVLFMSATFSDALSQTIKEFLQEHIKTSISEINKLEKYKELKRVKFKLRLNEYIDSAIEEIAKKGKEKRVLVITNTVENAVAIKQKLEEYEDVVSILLHGRFMYYSRKKKENIVKKFKESLKPHVLISTQVCEVSLDISYDYLYTELAPFPSLIQRFGRVNRKGKETSEYNVFIFKPKIKEEKRYPYEEEKLKEAEDCLKKVEDLESEWDLIQVFNEVESKEKLQHNLKKAEHDLNLNRFEGITKLFFPVDLGEDEIKNILSYRGDFTTLIIPYNDLIIGEHADKVKKEINNILTKLDEKRDLSHRLKLYAKLKGFAVNVPFFVVLGRNIERSRGLPIISEAKDFVYDTRYGFINQKLIKNLI
ncbi:MAG: CRISPR-associated helicase Cas3' [Candidatus Aenigmatarchaeota archaeon]